MKRKNSKLTIIGSCIAAVSITVGTAMLFIDQTNQMVKANTLNTIAELAEHDLANMHNDLESSWTSLEHIEVRLRNYNSSDIHELLEEMNIEAATNRFTTLYLVDQDSVIYSSTYMVYPDGDNSIISSLEGETEQVVKRYDYDTTSKAQREMVLFAIPLEDFTVGDENFQWLAGLCNLSMIQDRMIINSFEKDNQYRGYSSVFDESGNFIVNIQKGTTLNQRENMFDQLADGKMSNGWSEQKIRNEMDKRTVFSLDFTSNDGSSEFFYFIPVEDTDWYFVSMVEKSVFTDVTRAFVTSSAMMVTIAFTAAAVLLLSLWYFQRKATVADAEAKARSEFLSNMSHEIRTPLNGVLGLLYLIENHIDADHLDELKAWSNKASAAGRYLLGLINDILDMSKLQAGRLDIRQEPVNLQEVIETAADLERNVKQNGLNLNLDLSLPWPDILADRQKIQQVLTNLLSNAGKFTPDGKEIWLKARQNLKDETTVSTTLICQDSGIGMSKEFQQKIWDSFTQEHNQISDGTKGTGLGMPITREIIRAMGGTIDLVSEPGKGSTFTIQFEAPIDFEAINRKPQPETEQKQNSERSLKILIAEDNELNAEILEEVLAEHGFETEAAENGQKALDLLLSSQPGEYDLVLMDMKMPVMDGLECTRLIRTQARSDIRKIPIFACSASSFKEDMDRAESCGVNGYLSKPVEIDKLLELLKTCSLSNSSSTADTDADAGTGTGTDTKIQSSQNRNKSESL